MFGTKIKKKGLVDKTKRRAFCSAQNAPPRQPSNLTLLRMVQPCFENAARGGYFGTPITVDQAVGVPDHFENGPSAAVLAPGEYLLRPILV
jgi:hypothetical protein